MKLFRTWKKVMFDPVNFYEKLPKKIGYREPTIFFLKITAISLGLFYLLLAVIAVPILTLVGLVSSKISSVMILLGIGIALLVYPLLILFSWGTLYLNSALTHLFVVLFKGKEGFQETFKVVAYSMAPTILSFIPVANYLVGIYALILQGIGIHHKQKLSVGKSVIVVLLPLLIVFIIVLGLYFILFTFNLVPPLGAV